MFLKYLFWTVNYLLKCITNIFTLFADDPPDIKPDVDVMKFEEGETCVTTTAGTTAAGSVLI